ncbi:MAG: hypothetical protein HOW97_04655 [Catenulispora sp.]|nr:hypothetical protein [Catenulispora sp.]
MTWRRRTLIGVGFIVLTAGLGACGGGGSTKPALSTTGSTAPAGSTPAPGSASVKDSVRVTYTAPPDTPSGAWDEAAANLRRRAKEQKLDDVTVALSGSSIVVSGRAAEKDRLLALAAPGVLQFRVVLGSAAGSSHTQPTMQQSGTAPASPAVIQDFVTTDCTRQTPQTGLAMAPNAPIAACDLNHQSKYLLDVASVSGTEIRAASASAETTGGSDAVLTGNWQVNLSFNSSGSKTFADVTQKISQDGGQFAIVMDGIVYSAPTAQGAITDGEARISGTFTQKDAENLAAILQAGALPLHLTVADVETVK